MPSTRQGLVARRIDSIWFMAHISLWVYSGIADSLLGKMVAKCILPEEDRLSVSFARLPGNDLLAQILALFDKSFVSWYIGANRFSKEIQCLIIHQML